MTKKEMICNQCNEALTSIGCIKYEPIHLFDDLNGLDKEWYGELQVKYFCRARCLIDWLIADGAPIEWKGDYK